jgi:hypothetical protein
LFQQVRIDAIADELLERLLARFIEWSTRARRLGERA